MAVRTDIVVDPTRSPRIITVLAPSTEVVIQDLHDTLRAFEDSNEGHPFDILVDSAGKEPLGGGVSVGVTTTLQNALLEFEPRNEAADEGTATTADPAGLLLIDSTASFLSTVEVGAHVLNATTGATSTVRAVDSDTQLSLEGLGGGTRQDWQVGDQFYVYNVAQCAVSGGNLVAVDDVGAPLDTPLYPSFCTQVKLASSSSATLQELSAIQYASFDGGVTVDVTSSNSGTLYPVGTREFPVNNMADANTIADTRGFRRFYINGNLTLDTVDVSDGHVFEGESETLTTITINPGANVTNCEFFNARVTGTLDGNNTLRRCEIVDLNVVNGFVLECGLEGTITLGGATQAYFIDCHSGVAGTATPTIDFGGSGQSLVMRRYSGGVKFQNRTGTDAASVDILSGQVVIDSTVTAGVITLRGRATVTNNADDARINVAGLEYPEQSQLTAFKSFIWYDDTGVTGTGFPKGTPQEPVNNLADALTIAAQRGLTSLHVAGTLTIGASDDISGFILEGENELTTRVVLTPGCTTADTIFIKLILSGEVGGAINCYQVELDSVTNIGSNDGTSLLNECILLEGTTGMRAGLTTPGHVQFFNCFSCVSSGTGSTLDMNGTTTNMALREYNGALKIINSTGGNSVEYELDQGSLEFDATNTSGTATLRGQYALTDNSGAGFTIVEEGGISIDAGSVWSVDLSTYTTAGTAGNILRKAYGLVKALLGLV